ncbi:MAG: ammonium transporter, partial [Pseudomonadota bacterium]
MDESLLDILWVLVCSSLVLIMQGGFLCLESGLTRTKNAINVAMKNIVDLTVAILVFWAFGFGLMFGADQQGLIGLSHFFPDVGSGDPWLATFFVFQAMFCATAATIVAGAIAERVRLDAYIFITILVTGLVYPVFGHWAWGSAFGEAGGWLGNRGFVDFAGSTVVHSVGGWVALAAAMIAGPRLGRFDKQGANPIPPSNLQLCMSGLLLFVVGWIGFNGGSTLSLSEDIPGIVANTVLAAAIGASTAWGVGRIVSLNIDATVLPISGALAGLVSITAACHAVSAPQSILIGFIGALCMLLCDHVLVKHRIDDAVGAIPVHLAAGAWGTLAIGIFADPETLGTGLTQSEQLIAQLEGIIACGVWSFGVTYIVLKLWNPKNPIRVSADAEKIGLNISEHGARTPLVELLEFMEIQRHSGDLSLRAPVEPFTEVGQIADSYNHVMLALESATAQTRRILSDIRDGIMTLSRDGVLRSLNPGAAKLLSLEPAVVIGTPIDRALADSGLLSDPTVFLRSVNEKANQTFEVERQNGEDKPSVLEVTTSETLINGEPGVTALVRDITERRGVEEQLFHEKELAQVTLDSLGEGVVTADAAGTITYLNPVAEDIMGIRLHTCVGDPLNRVLQVFDEETDEPVPLDTRHDADGLIRHNAVRLATVDDSVVIVKLTAAPIRDRSFTPIGTVVVLQDVSKARALEQQLSYQASHDAITGLINRREFERRLRELIVRARTDNSTHVLCYVDLDQFKIVNDTSGHNAGDELLRQLSGLLAEGLRGSDTLARLGGDEFGVIFDSCSVVRGVALAEELRENIEAFRFRWRDATFSVGASIGIVAVSPQADSASEVMSMADAACYIAKDAGRNRVHVHQIDDSDTLERRGQMQWAARIQQAIDDDRLRLYYQPIMPINS